MAGSSAIWMPDHWLRAMIEASIVIDRTPMSSSVVAAFLLLGFLKAGTPLEMASTPVRAAHPDEKARSNRNPAARPVSSVPPSGRSVKLALSAGASVPLKCWMKPKMPMPMMARMNRYTGSAKALPDSLTPRRFMAVMKAMTTTATITSLPRTKSSTVAAFCTPELTETATVSV